MKAKALLKKLMSLENLDIEIPMAATVFGNGETDKNIQELFKTSCVTFEILFAKADRQPNNKRLKARVERLRKGALKAAELCDVALEGPEYRFLTDNEPWYGTEDFK